MKYEESNPLTCLVDGSDLERTELTDPTAITSAQAKERDSESEYYTTSGVKLPGKPVYKGVYIVR